MVGTRQTTGESAGFHLRLPCDPTSVPKARSQVREWCLDAQIRGDVLSDVQLAVTEAAANAVRHSGCVEFEVHGRMGDSTLVLSVWDRGRGRDDAEPGGGMGKRIIRALAESVDFDDMQPGTRVTMRFRRHTYM